MKNILCLFSLCLSFVVFSCEEWKVEGDRESISDKLVIYAVLCPEEDSIKINISKVKEIGSYQLSGLGSEVDGAIIKLKSNSSEINIPYFAKSRNYKIATKAFPLLYNSKYIVEVGYNNNTFQASTVIPAEVENPTISVYFQKDTLFGTVNWQKKVASRSEYYLSHSILFDTKSSTILNWKDDIFSNQSKTLVLNTSSNVNLGSKLYLGDDRNKNKNFKSIVFSTTLYSIDENMSKYVKSTSNANDTPNNNPEFIEKFTNSTTRYSNFSNAEGVLMSFSKKTAIFKFERP